MLGQTAKNSKVRFIAWTESGRLRLAAKGPNYT